MTSTLLPAPTITRIPTTPRHAVVRAWLLSGALAVMAGTGCAVTDEARAPDSQSPPVASLATSAPAAGAGLVANTDAASTDAANTTTAATAQATPAIAPAEAASEPRPPPADNTPYGQRADVMQAAQEFALRHGLDPALTASRLSRARYQASVARLIMPPPVGTAKNWSAYRARFVEPKRIAAGVAFWRQHHKALARAQAVYGVPAEIVAGILGVETLYGRHMGNYRAIDALATLAFDFPPGRRDRSGFFRDELGQLLLLAHREGIEPDSLRASYAGALGLPQFMPSSWNRHAVDFDGDGHVDLRGNPSDAIGSVAHYLSTYGWTPGMPPWFEVTPPSAGANLDTLLAPDIVPSFSPSEMAARGAVLPPEAMAFDGKLALVMVENGDDPPSYVAGTPNFYVVTRYNWSSYYAMAVIDLGRAVRQARERP